MLPGEVGWGVSCPDTCPELILREMGVFRGKAVSMPCFAPGREGAVCCTLSTWTLVLMGGEAQ